MVKQESRHSMEQRSTVRVGGGNRRKGVLPWPQQGRAGCPQPAASVLGASNFTGMLGVRRRAEDSAPYLQALVLVLLLLGVCGSQAAINPAPITFPHGRALTNRPNPAMRAMPRPNLPAPAHIPPRSSLTNAAAHPAAPHPKAGQTN